MPTVMIIDDDLKQLLLYKEELETAGLSVTAFANVKEALDKIKEKRPDVISLDIQMPGTDGIEGLSRILAYDKTIPVVIHTAYATYKDNFMTWSADSYVVKSSDLTEYKEAVMSFLTKKSLSEVC